MGNNGEIITFYSFKGGTGRSMAVANVAYLLARKGSVLAIDWDLDAPGLIHYFRPLLAEPEAPHEGVIELFEDLRLPSSANDSTQTLNNFSLERFVIPTTVPNLSFMPAG